MNYKKYKVIGKHKDTNRKRTLTILAKSEDMAKQSAINQNLLPPLQIEVLPFDPPTERQLDFANGVNIQIPLNATSEDVSCLLSRYQNHDSDPNPGLIEFADSHNIFFSYLIGKKCLYNLIFSELTYLDKTAFFIFSIYRWLSDDRHANLDTHPKKDLFYNFAELMKDDTSFQKSLLKYKGEDLRFFGTITSKRDDYISTYEAGSNKTIAYKKAAEFLNIHFNTPLIKTKTFTDRDSIISNSNPNNKISNVNRTTSPGCLLSLIIFIIYISQII